jgi:hypothetical protein
MADTQQRAPRQDILNARAAQRVLKPFHAKMESWQHSAARLGALASARRHDRSRLREDIEELSRDVSRHVCLLEQELAVLPPAVQSNTRISDTRRAIAVLDAALRRMSGSSDP